MAKGYSVTGLSNYVKENQDLLIQKIVLKGSTIEKLRKQLGVKTKERLHVLDVDPILQSGENCGFTSSGSTVISEREIVTSQFKVNDEFCERDLLGKYAEFLVKIGNNNDGDEFAFEAEIMGQMSDKINNKMEKLVWQGDTSDGDLIDGFLTQAEGADSGATVTGSVSSAATMIDAVNAAYFAIPEEILDKQAKIFLSPANYRKLVAELVENYKYNSDLMNNPGNSVVLPGTDVEVVKAIGLMGVNNKIYAGTYDNMFYGADLMNDSEEIKAWFSDDDDVFKVKARWNAGVVTAIPEYVVVITIG